MMRSLKGSTPDVNHFLEPAARAPIRDWFETPLGRSLQAVEAHCLRTVLPSLYGTVALQLGHLAKLDFLDACVAPTRIVVEPGNTALQTNGVVEQKLTGSRRLCVRATADELPFDERSVDVVLLPHTLDFSDDPYPVLREVSRVLRPEGHVVILGFNPMSLWGLRRLLARRPRSVPWCAHFFRLARVKDWLALLDFEYARGNMLFYRPPLRREPAMERLHFLEHTGDRWWPMMAGVYLVVAKKRVFGMTTLPVAWKTEKVVGLAGAAPKPAVFGKVSRRLHRRVRRHA
jgi:SAM-dependent methyltransferase